MESSSKPVLSRGLVLVVAAIIGGALLVALLLTRSPAPSPVPMATQDPANAAHAAATTQASVAGTPNVPAGHGAVDPAGPAVELLSARELKARIDAGTALLVDVRPGAAYASGHLPGAFSLAAPELEAGLRELPAEGAIVTYGEAARPEAAARAAQIFLELGYARALALEGGLEAWQAAGFALEK